MTINLLLRYLGLDFALRGEPGTLRLLMQIELATTSLCIRLPTADMKQSRNEITFVFNFLMKYNNVFALNSSLYIIDSVQL